MLKNVFPKHAMKMYFVLQKQIPQGEYLTKTTIIISTMLDNILGLWG